MAITFEGLPAWPVDDFSIYGAVREVPIRKVQKITGQFLHRNWLSIPHVFHHDEIDVTEMEKARKQRNAERPEQKITPLIPLVKAVVAAIDAYPIFATSLNEDGSKLIYKDYRHIGVAVDTPGGLLVPVLRDCDQKSLDDIAKELGAVSVKARDKGLSMDEMSGGVFSISSLGHLGGTAFTPIINAPQVAILGVTKMKQRLVKMPGGEIEERAFMPLSLSYDHRVINGADAARFVNEIGKSLSDGRHSLA